MYRTSLRRVGSVVALIGTAVLLGAPARAQLLVRHDLPYTVALTMAQAALESCAGKGYALSAVVVDRAGATIVAIRADDAGPHTMENARRKAYTAIV